MTRTHLIAASGNSSARARLLESISAALSGGRNTTTPGFFDIRTLMLWIRFRGHL